jgi:hypothetical protein
MQWKGARALQSVRAAALRHPKAGIYVDRRNEEGGSRAALGCGKGILKTLASAVPV